MPKKADTYYRAKIEILNYLICFATTTWYGEDNPYTRVDPKWSFRSSFMDASELKIGWLVKLQSAPFTKYYLGWLEHIELKDGGWHEYTIRSIEDGSLCRWANVGICVFSPETVAANLHWRWSDRQFEVWERFLRVFKRNDAYLTKPCHPTFHEDGSVTLHARPHVIFTANGEDFSCPKKTFPNWKKLTYKEMDEFYKEASSLIEKKTPKNKFN